MHRVIEQTQAEVVAEAAILTEGDKERWSHILSLGHIPVFTL
jgi:adenine phosphoribosyltransferase